MCFHVHSTAIELLTRIFDQIMKSPLEFAQYSFEILPYLVMIRLVVNARPAVLKKVDVKPFVMSASRTKMCLLIQPRVESLPFLFLGVEWEGTGRLEFLHVVLLGGNMVFNS